MPGSSRGPTSLQSGRAADRAQLVRALVAATIGTTIEWYDIITYGALANLVIAPLFFPSRDPLISLLAGNLGLLISFGARPVGGIVFGHIGDRYGRKAALVSTLLMAGIASTLIGVLPTFAAINVGAPIALLVLRFFVGAGIGGEWTGSACLVVEWARGNRRQGTRELRGFWGAWPAITFGLATVLSLAVIQFSLGTFGARSALGWRLPFLVSIVLVAVGLYVRLGVLETPVFSRLLESRKVERFPLASVLRRNFGTMLSAALVNVGVQAPTVMLGTFWLVFAAVGLHLSREIGVFTLGGGALVGASAPLLFGLASDYLGRRRVFMAGALVTLLMVLAYFPLLATHSLGTIVAANLALQLSVSAMAGPEAAWVTEAFTGRLRYSGAGIGTAVGALAAGLTAPLSVFLFQRFHSALPVGVYLAAVIAISMIGGLTLRERRDQDLAVEYDEIPEQMAATAAVTTNI